MLFTKPIYRAIVVASAAATVWPLSASAQDIEEIVVTAQRKTESIQDVPIAVSAFSADELQKRRIDDASDLQLAVPNLTFTGGNDFQIRGVGDSVGGTTGDVGVGIHHNNSPQVQSRIVTAEVLDMERIEVLRGPQGTLYGRNATGGVINYITAKPDYAETDFSLSAELGSYDTRRLKGMVNIPLSEQYALRFAANSLRRDGYTDNLGTGNDIDNRDLWSARATFGFEPTDSLRGWVLYEKFEEDDKRYNGARSLCIPDPGPTQVGSTAVTNPFVQNFLSQGCLPGSIDQPAAFGHPNSVGTFGGRFAHLLTLLSLGGSPVPQVLPVSGNLFAGQMQSTDLREMSEFRDPSTNIEHEIAEFEIQYDLNDELTLSLLGHQSEDSSYVVSGSYEGSIQFLDTAVTPGGVWDDFQHGPATGMRTLTILDGYTEQTSAELRLQSDYAGPVNFNVGALWLDVERSTHTWVSTNTTTLYLAAAECAASGIANCDVYHDPNPTPNYLGHQYFDTWTPYELASKAVFGELYVDLSDTLKLTTGLRYTDDTKERTNLEIVLLAPEGANGVGTPGYPPSAVREDSVDFEEWTGRVVLDWSPDVEFSDSTLLYASYSRGYKAGGFNSPEQGVATFTPYEPEFVNAFEVGTKNIFGGGLAQLNATLFFYDYQDYQISKIEQFSARNENIDAEVLGLELESVFEPIDSLLFSLNVGWLDTEINSGTSIDPLNRTAGDPNFTVLRTFSTGCVAPTAVVEAIVQDIQANPQNTGILFNPCADSNLAALGAPFPSGIEQDLAGNELPQSPDLSVAAGLEYSWDMADWRTTFRADYSWKDDTYTSVFNGVNYELESWDNANLSLNFANYDMGLNIQVFAKNIFDDDTIVDYNTGSDGLGLIRNLTLLAPRLYGVNVSYNF